MDVQLQVKCVDSSCNPYLATAAIIVAGMQVTVRVHLIDYLCFFVPTAAETRHGELSH